MDKNTEWMKLDNAAKIYPANSNKKNTKVFRFACALKEKVIQEVLQKATSKTLEDFPLYKTVLKRGLFWYYLESSELKPIVTVENKDICAPIYDPEERSLLFRVSYYKKRINLEVYHVLSDGAGAMEFFKTLVANYLLLNYAEELKNKKIDLKYDASLFEKLEDSFAKYYDAKGIKRKSRLKTAYKIRGKKHSERRMDVIEGIFKTEEVLDLARKFKTSITVLVASILMKSISEEMSMRDLKKDIVLTIPVNLRQFFKSLSGRNFFGLFNVSYNFKNYTSLEDVIGYVDNIFKEKLNSEEMSGIINQLVALENNIILRAVPLIIKDYALNISTRIGEKSTTATLSNVGKITMPEELNKYIEMMSVYLSTNNPEICMCSFEDVMAMSFTSPFKNTNIQRNFFKTFSSLGVKVIIQSNNLEKGGK